VRKRERFLHRFTDAHPSDSLLDRAPLIRWSPRLFFGSDDMIDKGEWRWRWAIIIGDGWMGCVQPAKRREGRNDGLGFEGRNGVVTGWQGAGLWAIRGHVPHCDWLGGLNWGCV
jgi:hypothetical protein